MAVSRDQVDAVCASMPGATLAHPPELISWKVAGKMFVCFGGDGDLSGVSVKTDSADTAAMLIDAGVAIRAPYFHKSWVRLRFDETDLDELTHRVTVSYDLVRKSLTKAQRDALPEREKT